MLQIKSTFSYIYIEKKRLLFNLLIVNYFFRKCVVPNFPFIGAEQSMVRTTSGFLFFFYSMKNLLNDQFHIRSID